MTSNLKTMDQDHECTSANKVDGNPHLGEAVEGKEGQMELENTQNINHTLLDEAQHVVSGLLLTSVMMGHFLVIMRSEFDVTLSGEPYIALMLLLDLKSGKYISRVWNQALETGSALGKGKLLDACKHTFCRGRPCLGHPVGQKPFPRRMVATCKKVLGNDAGADEATCQECSNIKPCHTEPDGVVKEELYTDLDVKNDTLETLEITSSSIDLDDFAVGVDKEELAINCKAEEHLTLSSQEEEIEIEKSREPEEPSDSEGNVKSKHNGQSVTTAGRGNETDFIKKCPYCSKTFTQKSSGLARHLKVKHFCGNFKCQVCGFGAKFATDLIKHMNENCHNHDPLALCPNCKKKVAFQDIQAHYEDCITRGYKEIIAKSTGKGPQICPKCGKTSSSKAGLRIHLQIHKREQGLGGEPIGYCEKCGKKFISKQGLKFHLKNSHTKDPVACSSCDQKFASLWLMRSHRLKEHNPTLQCEYCEYTTHNRTSLKLHQRKHFDPTFKCSHCGKMFKHQQSLETHEREHTGERPFECNVCGKGFKSANVLNTHTKHVHKILKPGMKQIVKRVRKR